MGGLDLYVEDPKVGHGVLPPFRSTEGLVAQHAVKHHLNAKAKYDNDGDCDSCQSRAVVFGCQKAHAVDPDHEACCSPVMVVASCMLGLSVDVAEGNSPRALVRRLCSQWMKLEPLIEPDTDCSMTA